MNAREMEKRLWGWGLVITPLLLRAVAALARCAKAWLKGAGG